MADNPRSTAVIAGHPVHAMLVPFPIAFFVAAFLADIVYLVTGHAGWVTASIWLLAAGLVMAALAAVAGLTDYFGDRRIRELGTATRHMLGNVTAVVLEAINLWLRFSGGGDAVLPVGLLLSAVVTATLLYTGWLGGELVYVHRVGVADADALPHPGRRTGHVNGETRISG